ncbi:hypothetical protein KY335_04760 [Candidatus Woesearchaeota archaeon]|nr:hypothetical protein [Candidatus Woesearchaeota archaeon]MBW3014519.1 hypothetical protein [Candidatus Woesearchaeota archaeon]
MRANKRGILSEQLYILFGVLVVVIFTLNAYKFVNGIASKAGIQQQFAVRDLAMTSTTISGGPGAVVYALYIQKSQQKIFPGQLMLAFYDPKSEAFLNYAEYFFTFSEAQRFQRDKNLTDSVHVVKSGNEIGFHNLYSIPTSPLDMDCRNYLQTKTTGVFGENKIVIMPGNDSRSREIADNLFAALGGGLATGQNVMIDQSGNEKADIMLVLRPGKNSSVSLQTPSREAKKLACLFKKSSRIDMINQEYYPELAYNPSEIIIVIETAPGKDFSSEIADSILRYYHE